MVRIDCYVTEESKEKLSSLVTESGISLSKLISNIIVNHINSEPSENKFQLKMQYHMSQILGSIYDREVVTANAETVKSLIKKVDDRVASDIKI